MTISTLEINTAVEVIANGGSIADAINTLRSNGASSDTLAMLGAVSTFAGMAAETGGTSGAFLGIIGEAIQAGNMIKEFGNGAWTIDDLAAAAGLLGAALARNPSPYAQAAAAYFTLFSLAPAFGRWLGEKGYLDPVFNGVNTFFQNAMSWLPPRRDPLTLDLNGNGIETLAANGQVLFDQNGDGIKEGTGWIAPTDGMLVLDRNGNGLIDSGRELFGDNTIKLNGQLATNGFDALTDFDTNADGKIDATDAQWSQIKIWKDANSDGISQANELFSLNTVNGTGIKQINLANTAGSVNVGNGNIATANGTFVWNDNHVGTAESIVSNLNPASNPFYREFPALAIPEDKFDVADILGSGVMHNLREAA